MINGMCAICHDKQNDMRARKLEKIREILYDVDNRINGRIKRFNWGYGQKCRYGMPCPELQRTANRETMLIREIEPKLNNVLLGTDVRLKRMLLEQLRGDFPSVYVEVERTL